MRESVVSVAVKSEENCEIETLTESLGQTLQVIVISYMLPTWKILSREAIGLNRQKNSLRDE